MRLSSCLIIHNLSAQGELPRLTGTSQRHSVALSGLLQRDLLHVRRFTATIYLKRHMETPRQRRPGQVTGKPAASGTCVAAERRHEQQHCRARGDSLPTATILKKPEFCRADTSALQDRRRGRVETHQESYGRERPSSRCAMALVPAQRRPATAKGAQEVLLPLFLFRT